MRFSSKCPVLIPAGHTVVVEGSVQTITPSLGQCTLIEHPPTPLPGALCVESCLMTFPSHTPHNVPVILRNESNQDVSIPPLSIIAALSTFPQILSHGVSTPFVTLRSTLQYYFGDSPISAEWKKHITNKLNEIPDVFSHHDLDFGRTSKVKHNIKLHDETTFKHRPRPIHPQDIEAVRKHLRDLLESIVIRESESPFVSPIVVVRKKNGDVWLCIDYRKLNLKSIKDAYALPNLEE